MEARGNAPGYGKGGLGGVDEFSSTLHFGPSFNVGDAWPKAHGSYALPEGSDFSQDFHVFGLHWGEDEIFTYVDSIDNKVLSLPINQSFWQLGGWDKMQGLDNPWKQGQGSASAPFDRDFYLILNLAVGGVSGFFPDGVGDKPWNDSSSTSATDFWNGKEQWLPTWKESSTFEVDYVRVYQ